MKYAVILNGDKNAPHLKIYTKILDSKRIPYDIISWDRGGIFEKDNLTFSESSNFTDSSFKRLGSYYRFSLFIKKIVEKNQYEKLIVISPQVALFIPFFLKWNYKKKYIFDYRDLSLEQKAPFKQLLKVVLRNSFVNVISSPGFKPFLPKGFEYILSHNFDYELVKSSLNQDEQLYNGNKIRVLTIGGIRIDSNFDVIDSLGNRENIELEFVGKGDAAPVLEKYSKEKGFHNVLFRGYYKKEEEGNIYKNCTFVNIFYPKINSHISALSNRFYNSLIFKRPMIVTKGGCQASYVEKYNVGLSVDTCEELSEKLMEFNNNFDFKAYSERCNKLLLSFLKDYDLFLNKIDAFIKS